jgi:LmbE family N-acetylglucosaminyl deacetylase
MQYKIFTCFMIAFAFGTVTMAAAQESGDEKLRIIVFGAHPDDAELGTAGVAMKWSALGHHVKLVSVTNGDIGHWNMAGGPLAQRRKREVTEAGRLLGVTNEVLDIHDGELMPTLENRRMITRLIRDWKADVVITHRPNDYHPDHRYTSILVQDSAYMVTVPYFCPDTPFLKKNPVYLYTPDRFKKPTPFRADVAVAIDDVIETVLDALMVMESQFFEGGANGFPGIVPEDQAGQDRRRKEVRNRFANRYRRLAETNREILIAYYGSEEARRIEYAQSFEICEYGRQPSQGEIRKLFPFFGE